MERGYGSSNLALPRHLPCNQANTLDSKTSEGIQPIPVGKDASGSILR